MGNQTCDRYDGSGATPYSTPYRFDSVSNVGGDCDTRSMSTTLDDPVDVEFADGRPTVFWWERLAYVVTSGDLFYRRVQSRWWAGEGDPNRLDAEHWRVAAHRHRSGDHGQEKLYDLRKDPGGWRLVLSWDD